MEHKEYVDIHPGTFVTRSILNNLGSPDDRLKIIHIAGTNGKGSTAEYFTQILLAAGKRAGTFTSPAVYDFYDQFRLDGKSIEAGLAETYFGRALKAAGGLNATDFEIQTAGILSAFKEEGCEYAVIECGMGGLGDATNAINKKELAVITSISLEHTAYLGDTIEEICAQKAGIITGGCPVVVNPLQPFKEAENYFKNIGCRFADVKIADGYGVADNFSRYNAATAIEGARLLGLPDEAIRAGIKNTRLYGRVEEFMAAGRTYILDGAHNPAAFESLKSRLQGFSGDGLTLIFGCLKDKDSGGILSALSASKAKTIIAVPCPSLRSRTAEEVQKECLKHFNNVIKAQSVSEALDAANTETVAVCGSFTLLKEAKQWIEKKRIQC